MGVALDGHGGVFVQLAMLEGETGVMVVLAVYYAFWFIFTHARE
jgi:hypothetical protein